MQKAMLNDKQGIDLDVLIESRLLIQANSGGGKSWANRRFIEGAFGKKQIIVIDPEGEFANMRGEYDFIYIGKGGDAPAETKSAALLATRLLETKANAIIDIYEMTMPERKLFVKLFFDAMVNAPKELWHDCFIVLDEAHKFAPEKEESVALEAVADMASRGRKRGYCLIPATQRPAKLNKDVAAECNNKLIGRASLDIDRKRSAEELGFTTKEEVLSLRNLEPGEFYAFGPAISRDVVKLRIGDVKVKPPKRGQSKAKPPSPTEKVKALLEQFKDLPEEAKKEADTVQSLRTEVAYLKREASTHKCPVAHDPAKVKAEAEILVKKAQVEIERSFDEEHKRFRSKVSDIIKEAKRLVPGFDSLKKLIEEYESEKISVPKPVITLPQLAPNPVSVPRPRATAPPVPAVAHEGVSIPEQKVLDSIAWFGSIGMTAPNKISVAFLAGYSSKSGGYNNLCGKLRTAGLIEYTVPGTISLTDAGAGYANHPSTTLTREDLHAKVIETLPKPEGKVLQQLLYVYPDAMSNDELAAKSGYTASSGGFNNLKGRLRSLGLADYPTPGFMKAADILFP